MTQYGTFDVRVIGNAHRKPSPIICGHRSSHRLIDRPELTSGDSVDHDAARQAKRILHPLARDTDAPSDITLGDTARWASRRIAPGGTGWAEAHSPHAGFVRFARADSQQKPLESRQCGNGPLGRVGIE